MAAQETNLFNAFETTLATTMGSSDTTLTVAAVTDSYPTTLSAPFYIVINPDSATNREVILVTAVNTGTKELTTSVPNRYLPGSAASSGLSHSSGQVVRMAPLQQHIEDINDRVDTIINEDGTAVNTSLFLDEDDMVSDSATKGVTQQSVKAYVDSQVTAQDLDFLGDTGSGAVDLDSQNFTIAGTADEIETSASGQTLTIGLPSTITTTLSATSVLSDGVVATTQSLGDNSTKVATTAYVDAQVTAEDLDFSGDTGTGSVDLDSQTFTIQGTTNEIETSATGQTLTIGLPSSITVDVVGNLTGNVTGNVTGNLTGNVTGDLTGDVTGNVTGNVTGDVTGDVTGNLTGNVTGNVTGDLTGNVTATSVLADGVTATTQSAGDNSTKVATTAYVDSISVDDNLTVSDGTTSTTIDLDTQTFSVLGTANEIETTTSAQTITIGLPSNITVNVTGQVSDISNHSTTDLTEGTNLYYTTARFDTAFSGKSTTDLSEGTNLYYTDARANSAIDTRVDKAFVDALNVDADTLDGNDSTAFATSAQGALADSAIQPTDGVGDLSDVDTTGVTNGQVLAYNSTSGDFEPADPTTGDITAVNTNADSGLAGGAASGDVDLTVDPSNLADGSGITVDTSNDLLILEDVTDGTVYKVKPSQIASGSANALTDGDSDLTITDGINNGLDYNLDSTDMATWNTGGIALTTNGGIFRHHQTQAATYTCLLYTSPSPRDKRQSRMPSSA